MRFLPCIALPTALGLAVACAAPPDPPPRQPFNVVEAGIADLQTAITEGRATCREIVAAYLARIEAYDKTRQINAVTVLNPRALERAEKIDLALSQGKAVGPLFCAPILVKDNFDTHDLPTTGGSAALLESRPPDDAFMVRRLREADAIVIAKTNMAEWAFSPRQTVSSSYGVTANAYDPSRVPAGSSGGTASGVAASFAVAGLGSDTGNSIRGPSSHLALFGIRSTIGLTSRDGVIPLAFDRDIAGPMTRSVEDGARLFNVLAGYDPADPLTEEGKRQADYTTFLDPDGLQGAKLGVMRELVDTEDADPRVIALFEAALDDLRQAGATIVDPLPIPSLQEHLDGDYFCARFRYDMAEYLKTLGEDRPISDVEAAFAAGTYSPYVEETFAFFLDFPADVAPDDWAEPCPTYPHHPGRESFYRDLLQAMEIAGVEALLYPTWTNVPAPLDRGKEEYKGDNSQLIAPATGMPAVTVPMGFVESGDSEKAWPAGLQMVAARYDDHLLFRFSYAYEQATLHRRPPPDFPPL